MKKLAGVLALSNDRSDTIAILQALIATLLIFSTMLFAAQAYAAAVTLSVTVQTSFSFTAVTNAGDQFPALTPGTYVWATTTLAVTTNDVSGWTVQLAGDNRATGNNLQSGVNSITDQTEWVPNAATSSPGNAVIRTGLTNSGNVLAFRVMTASTTNSSAFTSTSWWGTTDADGTAKFAGIASSTVQRTIGNAGTGSYSASQHLNTVIYYLNVSASQPTGTYTAPLTFTGVAT
ncbi:MAG: hypothetical protein JWL82_12 [Parcubacteria group bacterium]|nr:hypothetical protein [Parcubacteria group bacterium]